MTAPLGDQGKEYAAFIQKELDSEHARREGLNARAATAVTGSTGLVTIVLAVVAIAKGKDFTLEGCDLTALIVALLLLLVSAASAIVSGFNYRYNVTSIPSMNSMLVEHWRDSEVTARNQAAYCNVVTINSLRKGTNIKFRWFITSTIAQGLAIVALGVTVIMVVT